MTPSLRDTAWGARHCAIVKISSTINIVRKYRDTPYIAIVLLRPLKTITPLRRGLCHYSAKRGIAIACRRPSVCPSETLVNQDRVRRLGNLRN